MNKELAANSTLSHYRIVSKLGAGGMGEVYLAQDTRLDRKVAIKFLHEEFSKDADKLNRFVQEAKAASALNHPNILTVYEIGEVDGKNYIATELIDGQTLREHLSRKESLQLNAILKIGVQVSEALSAAHQAGIIHRDIKPENIMLRRDGYAKVLDFGLAKLSEPAAVPTGSAGSEDATRVQVNTTPGMVMGTVSYMSPEQARGKATDARTDLWSLGVVLYEMLSGRVPFSGETINHTIVSILEKEPLLLENVPAELQRIVRKSMTKDVDMRYQSARDLLIDLKNLRRELDIQGELERSIIPNREAATESANENQTQVYGSGSVTATRSGQAAATQSVTTSSSSLEYAVIQAKSHKLVSVIVGTVLLAIITTVAYFAFVYKGGPQINSIAVMPFVNESEDKEVEYLSDGMTETLIGSLTRIPNLSVKASSTVFYYRGKNTSPKQLGEELGVEAVLLGRIVKRNEDLVLRLELVDTKTLDAIWSETYNRKMNALVSLQREIASDVSKKLRLKLTAAEHDKVTKSYTTDSEAQQYYLKGRFHWNKRKEEDFQIALEYFNDAIAED
jgi:eukaryotic-like serine/threonine-protein kinase